METNIEGGENLNPQDGKGVDGEARAELDTILSELDKVDPEDGGKKPTDGTQEAKPFYKKVGDKVFNSFEEYDKWAMTNYGTLSNTAAELERLKKGGGERKPGEVQASVDPEKIRWSIKVSDFFDEHPEAIEVRDLMATLLRTGAALDERGKPSLLKAMEMSFNALGKSVPTKEKSPDDNIKNQKRIMRSGGGDSGAADVYAEDNGAKSASEFADSAILGKV